MRCFEFRDQNCVNQKGYRRSYAVEALDSGQRLAQCHLFDYVEKGASITDADGSPYQFRPNKTLMPTRWDLTDANEQHRFSIERPASTTKRLNLLDRELFHLEDIINARRYQLVALDQRKRDLMLGPLSTGWYLLEAGTPVAAIEKRKGGQPVQSKRGLMATIKSLMQNAEWVLVDTGMENALSPIAFLGLIMLFDAHLARAQA